MDDAKKTTAGGEPRAQEPRHSRPLHREELPAAFIPLKLVLQPNGPVVELTRPNMVMGRHSEADVRLPLPDVSRRHCRFVFTDGVWQVFDLDSLNGVFVNDKRVPHAVLRDHDRLTIGGFQFTVDLSPAEASADRLGTAQEVIHHITDALPRKVPDIDSQRKAS
jgi:pSer/pThr/pTyr-binding forkhead associated (FHA) protein